MTRSWFVCCSLPCLVLSHHIMSRPTTSSHSLLHVAASSHVSLYPSPINSSISLFCTIYRDASHLASDRYISTPCRCTMPHHRVPPRLALIPCHLATWCHISPHVDVCRLILPYIAFSDTILSHIAIFHHVTCHHSSHPATSSQISPRQVRPRQIAQCPLLYPLTVKCLFLDLITCQR